MESGLVYRAGRGAHASYRVASPADLDYVKGNGAEAEGRGHPRVGCGLPPRSRLRGRTPRPNSAAFAGVGGVARAARGLRARRSHGEGRRRDFSFGRLHVLPLRGRRSAGKRRSSTTSRRSSRRCAQSSAPTGARRRTIASEGVRTRSRCGTDILSRRRSSAVSFADSVHACRRCAAVSRRTMPERPCRTRRGHAP